MATLVCSGVVIAAALTACGSNKQTAAGDSGTKSGSKSGSKPASGPIVIGMPIALTGPINAYDGNTLIGAQLAADAINKAGGVDGRQLKIITADTASNIAQGSTAAQQVISEGAKFIVPTIDYNYGGGAARAAQAHNLITLGAADDTRFGLSIGKNVFNFDTGGPTQGAALAQYAYSTLKWRKAYVLQDTGLAAAASTCNVGFRQSFDALGGTSTVDTFQQATESSVVSAVSRVQRAAAKNDGIVLCGNPPAGATVLRQIRAAGVKLPVELSTGFDGNFWESAVPDLSNTYVVSFGPVTPGQNKEQGALQAYAAAQKAGKTITQSLGFLTGYSSVQAIAAAVTATKSTDGDAVRSYFEAFTKKPFAIGDVTWNKTCHARAGNSLVIAKFTGGKEQYAATVTPTELPKSSC